jgi:hypothetical protein
MRQVPAEAGRRHRRGARNSNPPPDVGTGAAIDRAPARGNVDAVYSPQYDRLNTRRVCLVEGYSVFRRQTKRRILRPHRARRTASSSKARTEFSASPPLNRLRFLSSNEGLLVTRLQFNNFKWLGVTEHVTGPVFVGYASVTHKSLSLLVCNRVTDGVGIQRKGHGRGIEATRTMRTQNSLGLPSPSSLSTAA